MFFTKKSYTLIFIIFPILCYGQLIPNGGVEKLNDSSRLSHYIYKDKNYQSIDTLVKRSGKQSAKFNYTGDGIKTLYFYGNRARNGIDLEYIPVKEGQKYELSFYFKTSSNFKPGVNRGVYGQFSFKDKNDVTIGFDENEPTFSSIENYDTWRKVTFSTTITSNISKIAAGIFYRGKGPAWIDDISLKLVSSSIVNTTSFETDSIIKIDPQKKLVTSKELLHIEKSQSLSYKGLRSLAFKNSSKDKLVYYTDTNNSYDTEIITVSPNDLYTISGFYRVDDNFKGKGIRLSILLYNKEKEIIHIQNSLYGNQKKWSKIAIDSIRIPANVDGISYRIEANGEGKSWFDNLNFKQKNLIKNSGFEATTEDKNVPDFWYPRMGKAYTISGVEMNPSLVFSTGKKSATFKNNTGIQNIAYYSGPYNASEKTINHIPVNPGETYQLSAHLKTENIIGKGVRISLLFFNGEDTVLRSNSHWFCHTNWTKETIKVTVPEGYNSMEYRIEYSGSSGKAWFDDLQLSNTYSQWYHADVSIDSFEKGYGQQVGKRPIQNLSAQFSNFHIKMEKIYNKETSGTWKNPYGCPWVRLSANASIGYLNANEAIPNKMYVKRAKDALQFLLKDQQENGSFGLHRLSNCKDATYDHGSVMYEGSIATVALLTGYRLLPNHPKKYIESAESMCDYMVQNIPPSTNANFNGFAIWALAEYNAIAPQEKEEYLKKALDYFERLHEFQLDNGMWSDAHNQLIHYHGIITRGIVNLYRVMPDNHPKKEAVRHAMYKAINHIIKSQRSKGKLIRFPGKEDQTEDNFPLEAVLNAYTYLDISDLEDTLNKLALGAENMSINSSQGHRFAALGLLLNEYYRD